MNYLILLSLLLPTDEPVFSGPQPGEKLTPFEVQGAIREDADMKFDIVAEAGDKPVVLVFVHKRTRPAFGLANTVMRLMADRKDKAAAGMIFLTADPTESATWLNTVQRHLAKGVRIGISTDGIEGPGAYGLNRNVTLTVLVAKNAEVTANFALVQPGLEADGPQIFKAIAEALGEERVPALEKYAGGQMRTAQTPRRGDAPNGRDPMLANLLRPLIQKDATDAQVLERAKAVEDYAAKHPASRGQIGDIARRIIAADKLSNYGTEKCQEFLTKWAREFKAPESPKARQKTTDQSSVDQKEQS